MNKKVVVKVQAAVKKPSAVIKAAGFEWIKTAKDAWSTSGIPKDDSCYPRIKELDSKTFSVYRDGKYLGSEKTFDLAAQRVRLNKLSAKNAAPLPPPPKPKPPPAIDPAKAPKRAALAGLAGTPTPKGRGRTTDVPSVGTIRVKAGATVPKKPGTAAHARWTLLWGHDGKPVTAYAKAGGNMETLANAMATGCVKIEEEK